MITQVTLTPDQTSALEQRLFRAMVAAGELREIDTGFEILSIEQYDNHHYQVWYTVEIFRPGLHGVEKRSRVEVTFHTCTSTVEDVTLV